jgi:cytochrome c553
MHPIVVLGCLLAAASFAPSVATAADAAAVAAGKEKAAACAVCHGLDGLSKNPDAPNLAGDSANYLVKQLKAFKTGARRDEQMSIMAEGLSDDDIANLAAWYSNLKVTVDLPQ